MSTLVSGATLAALGERGVIAKIRERVPRGPSWIHVGIGDDAAVVAPERGALEVLTTDALVEGVHFDRRFSSPRDIGWKALAVNVSDVAAMGGTARVALLSLVLPETFSVDDLDALLDGFMEGARAAGVVLAGGNVARSPGPLVVDVMLSGSVRRRRALLRTSARPDDQIYVTGAIGAGAAGLAWLRAHAGADPNEDGMEACVARYRRPDPRARIGALLGRNRAASACMDLSDGLADAVRQVSEASGVGAVVHADLLPIPAAARLWFERAGLDPVAAALAGGDDYELLVAVPRRARGRFATVTQQSRGVPLTRIGEFTRATGIVLARNGVAEALPAGFVHF